MERQTFRRLAASALGASIALAAGAAAAQPNLVPVLNSPMNATVGVQNIGTSAAGPSQLTINCTRMGLPDGGCPDAPGMAAYVDPAYPNRAVIEVPALEPNESFSHDISFWAAIPWTPGTYLFDAVADAGQDVEESIEADNTTQSSYTQQPGIAVQPPPPLPVAAQPAPARPVKPARLDSTNVFQLKQRRDATRQKPAAPQRLAPVGPSEPKRLQLRAPAN